MQNNKRLQILIEIALFAALAMILDFIPTPKGFKITVKMLPIIILALRRGLWPGIMGGLLWSILQIVLGEADIISPVQVFLDYLFSFSLIGMAGLFQPAMQRALAPKDHKMGKPIGLAVSATLVGSFLRYCIHFISGFVYYGQYAPEGQSPYLYSFLFNGTDFLFETATCIVVMIILAGFYNTLIRVKEN
jgi:thiamine transporter